jgi:phosphoenolpyruvate-protein phosphotransferase
MTLRIVAPFAGWCMPLAEVPDEVFAQRMAGDGVAVDPLGDILHAPCDGRLVPMKDARHAVTVRTDSGVEVLLHVGIDTVELKGEGFEFLAAPDRDVRAGDPLLRFDLDFIARRAKSAATPIVIAAGGSIVRRVEGRRVKLGDLLLEVETAAVLDGNVAGRQSRRRFSVPFDHGLHVRPAALVAAALRPFDAQVHLTLDGRRANARSTVAMMALGAQRGDRVEALAVGLDADAALTALENVLGPVSDEATAAALPAPATAPAGPRRLNAAVASRGVVCGPATPWSQPEIPVAEKGAGEAGETSALQAALESVRERLEAAAAAAQGEQRELLEAHAMLVADPELMSQARERLRAGKSAGFAWRAATRATAEALAGLRDERMRERAADLRDIEGQVLRALTGEPPTSVRKLAPGAIVIAEDLLPSQFMALDPRSIGGICLARGGPTSHVALVAASHGIPMLVAAGDTVLDIDEGTAVIVDAERGWIDVDPPPSERAAAEATASQRAAQSREDLAGALDPAVTTDGVRIIVKANLGTAEEARVAVAAGAEGCGLLRTEFLFLDRREPPGEDEQAAEYHRIARALDGRPLNVRTLDAAGDKPVAYLPMPREDNPALGLRGIRATRDRPDILRTQLRAVLRVSPPGACRVLLPMVNDLEELRAVRALAVLCAAEMKLDAPPAIGVMIETPSAALLANQLAREADFLSLGTNDLAQYTLAVDRGHPNLGARLDALHPAVLRLIAVAADAAREAGKPIAVCGALGSDPDALPMLIGLGVREISASTAAIPRLKRTIRGLNAAACTELARRALELESAQAVRSLA